MHHFIVPCLLVLAGGCHDVPLVASAPDGLDASKVPQFAVGFTHTSGPLAPWNLADPSTKIRTEDACGDAGRENNTDYWGIRVLDARSGANVDCDSFSGAPGAPFYGQDVTVTFDVHGAATEGSDFHLLDETWNRTTSHTLTLPWDVCGGAVRAEFVNEEAGDPSGEWPEEIFLTVTSATVGGTTLPLGTNNPVRWFLVDMH